MRVEEIRGAQEYGGKRVILHAYLDSILIRVQIDIGFGDAVTPEAVWSDYPVLLPFPLPRLRMYPKETVIAEKLHAMVALGILNSRMKDFYDLWTLARLFDFEGDLLVQAIQATFARRQTAMPADAPTALTADFANHADKMRQWDAFIARNRLAVDGATLAQIIAELHKFLLPPLQAGAQRQNFRARWAPPGPWRALDPHII